MIHGRYVAIELPILQTHRLRCGPSNPEGVMSRKFIQRIPTITICVLILGGVTLGKLFAELQKAGVLTDAPEWFPISVFAGPTLHWTGLPFLAAFVAVLAFTYRYLSRMALCHIWLAGLALIVLGNLGQGDWDTAFQKPFYESQVQYFHDAISIDSPG